MELTDDQLMEIILHNKDRYKIVVDNDVVWVQDNEKDEEDEDYWVAFNEYGYNLIPTIFKHLGVKADFV
jgi:hypothetical protein